MTNSTQLRHIARQEFTRAYVDPAEQEKTSLVNTITDKSRCKDAVTGTSFAHYLPLRKNN